jgi:hypothetical protein
MHVHVRIPGLREDLTKLKLLQAYISKNAKVYDLVHRYEKPDSKHKLVRKRYMNVLRSRKTVLLPSRVAAQLKAKTPTEFFEAEAARNSKTGVVMYHGTRRSAISLRQLLQTDTIEFRHFCSTLDMDQILTAIHWCRDYLRAAFDHYSAVELFRDNYQDKDFPDPHDYPIIGWMENRWMATNTKKNNPSVRKANIQRILSGEFDNAPASPKWLKP